MSYQGGKHRLSKYYAQIFPKYFQGKTYFVDAFVGAANVIEKFSPSYDMVFLANDANKDLIALWQQLQLGWEPPQNITKKEYIYIYMKSIKDDLSPHMRAFVGIFCSYAGKLWGGYAQDANGRNYPKERGKMLMAKARNMSNVFFNTTSFFDLDIENAVIYCDPPYEGTTQNGYQNKSFDSNLFWNKVQSLANRNNTLIISEYTAPPEYICIWEMKTKTTLAHVGEYKERTEKLFLVGR